MSQAGLLTSGGAVIPGDVAIDYVTDFGIAVPAANILNVPGGTTSDNNVNRIQTTGSGNTLTVEITNHLTGSLTTSGAVTSNIITFPLGVTPGTYTFDCDVVAFESTNPAGAGYNIWGTIRTTGAAAIIVGIPDKIVNEDAALILSDVSLTVSGNSMILQVSGIAGLNINWESDVTYTKVN